MGASFLRDTGHVYAAKKAHYWNMYTLHEIRL